jgi:hypothetical protein
MVGGDALQISQTSSRHVQLLLWAVGEARDRARRPERDRPALFEDLAPADDADFFTEWQPAAR